MCPAPVSPEIVPADEVDPARESPWPWPPSPSSSPASSPWRRGRAVTIAAALSGVAGLSWLRAGLAGTLRLHDDGLPMWGRAGLWVAMAALFTVAGVQFLRAHRDAAAVPLGRLLAGALLIHLLAAPALPLTSSDLFSNLAYGRLSALGHNPYLATPIALDPADAFLDPVYTRWRDTPTVYGPVAAMANALAGRAGTVTGALAAYKLVLLLATLGTVLVAYALCRSFADRERAARSFVFLAWNPLLAWEVSAQAHNDGLMVLATVAFVWAVLAGREWLAVACLAAALWAKFAVAPVLGLYLLVVARRSPARALAMAGLVAAVGVALFAPYWEGLATLAGPSRAVGTDAARHTRSFTDLAYWAVYWLGPTARVIAYRIGWGAGLIVLAAVGIRALLRTRSMTDVLHQSLVFLLLYDLVGAPWFQPWYVAWLLPLAVAHTDPRWQRLVAVYTVLSLVQYGVPIDPVTYAGINAFTLVWMARLARAPLPGPIATTPTPTTAASA